MMNPTDLDASYNNYVDNLSSLLPDGIINVDTELLSSLNLLDEDGSPNLDASSSNDHSFYIFESEDKITLTNDEYVVWIVPQNVEELPTTYTFVAKNETSGPNLELVFSASGSYNSSAFILKILESFLNEIDENENCINSYSL